MENQTEEPFEFLIQLLAKIPSNMSREALNRTQEAHLFLPPIVSVYWRKPPDELTDGQFTVFYDAVWELARIGVLRPGRVAPRDQYNVSGFGDHWSITNFGFKWLSEASLRPFLDMSRISEVLTNFVPLFGEGFGQRAVEAVRTYRTLNYLSSCTMAGAAAESILLAAAVAKSGNEAEILKEYSTSRGRASITRHLIGQATNSVQRQFQAALQILHYWRDDASHGQQTTIGEVEAYAAISQLLRLAQFTSDHWDVLTARYL